MEDIECIFCNKSSNDIVIEESGYKGKKCPNCGLIYISPRPTFSEIQNLYSQDQAHISAESHISQAFGKRLFAKHNLQIIEKFKKNGSLLEIGAGAGYFLDEARKRGFEVYGIEFNSTLVNFTRSNLGIPCEESSLDNSLFDGKKFDIIYHCDVISHFYDPIAEFKTMNARLKDDGILVFQTGNGGDIRPRYYRLFTTFQYPDHLFSFSENNLQELLKRAGFEFIEIHRYSIVLQLLIIKILGRVIGLVKSRGKFGDIDKNSTTEEPSSSVSNSGDRRPIFMKLMRSTYDLFAYLIRYKMGYVMPKEGQPQTVIVIARKGK